MFLTVLIVCGVAASLFCNVWWSRKLGEAQDRIRQLKYQLELDDIAYRKLDRLASETAEQLNECRNALRAVAVTALGPKKKPRRVGKLPS